MPKPNDPRSSTNAARPRRFLLQRRKEEDVEVVSPERESVLFGSGAGRTVAITNAADIPGLIAGGLSTANLSGKVGTAARCLQLCAQQIASSPLRYRRKTPAPAGKDYAPPWISTPDPAYFPNGIRDAIFATVWSIYSAGDAFLWTTSRDADGYPDVDRPRPSPDRRKRGERTRVYRYASVLSARGRPSVITRNPTGAFRGTSALRPTTRTSSPRSRGTTPATSSRVEASRRPLSSPRGASPRTRRPT